MGQAKETLKQQKELLQLEQQRNQKLKDKLVAQAQALEEQGAELQSQLQEQSAGGEQLDALRSQLEREFEAKLDSRMAALNEKLEERELELYYRDEQVCNMRQEVAQLRRDKLRMLNDGADKFLDKLHSSGITFVVYHAGAGHLTIPLNDVGR